MNIYTVAFFGHRQIENYNAIERKISELIKSLLLQHEYVEFLVGKNGEFDQMVSSVIRRLKRLVRNDNSALTLILPYPTEEYLNNQSNFESYYDTIEICHESSVAHFKRALSIRNQHMIDRADIVITYVNRNSGGAYQALQYAQKQKKTIINIADNIKKLREP